MVFKSLLLNAAKNKSSVALSYSFHTVVTNNNNLSSSNNLLRRNYYCRIINRGCNSWIRSICLPPSFSASSSTTSTFSPATLLLNPESNNSNGDNKNPYLIKAKRNKNKKKQTTKRKLHSYSSSAFIKEKIGVENPKNSSVDTTKLEQTRFLETKDHYQKELIERTKIEIKKIMPKRKSSKSKSKFYAVAIGRNVGIYTTWDECQRQVKGYSSAKFKSFVNRDEAEQFVAMHSSSSSSTAKTIGADTDRISDGKKKRRTTMTDDDGDDETNNAAAAVAAAADTTSSFAASINNENNNNSDDDEDILSSELRKKKLPYKLWFHVMFDGGSRGNPNGHAGSGTYITTRKFYNDDDDDDDENNTVANETKKKKKKSKQAKIYNDKMNIRSYLGFGQKTNNQAEYNGLIVGLEHVLKQLRDDSEKRRRSSSKKNHREVTIVVQGDSDLIMKQMNGLYRCKSPKLISSYQKSISLLKEIKTEIDDGLNTGDGSNNASSYYDITFEHVYRENNTVADRLANEAMDGKRSWITTTTTSSSSSSS